MAVAKDGSLGRGATSWHSGALGREIRAEQGEFQKPSWDFMIAPFLKVPRRGDVKRLEEVNHHPPRESRKPCMKMQKKFRMKKSFIYLMITN
jgi:hypothetical protein